MSRRCLFTNQQTFHYLNTILTHSLHQTFNIYFYRFPGIKHFVSLNTLFQNILLQTHIFTVFRLEGFQMLCCWLGHHRIKGRLTSNHKFSVL